LSRFNKLPSMKVFSIWFLCMLGSRQVLRHLHLLKSMPMSNEGRGTVERGAKDNHITSKGLGPSGTLQVMGLGPTGHLQATARSSQIMIRGGAKGQRRRQLQQIKQDGTMNKSVKR
jgi:hypothetical protein